MKPLALASVALSIALAALLWLAREAGPAGTRSDAPSSAYAADSSTAALRAELMQLRAEVRALRAESAAGRGAGAATSSVAVPPADVAAASEASAPDSDSGPDPDEVRLAALRAQLDSAPRHYDAERAATQHLAEALAQVDLPGLRAGDVLCTAEVCRIELDHEQLDEGMDFVAHAMTTPLLAGEFIALPPAEVGQATQLFLLSQQATE